jgi:glycerol-1-phosphate dehydrogenase [NAD(P)+]
MAGIAMSTAGETTPLSGYEHVISHALDFLRLASGQELVFHGEQVALGSLISARTIDWLLELPSLSEDMWRLEATDDAFRNLAGMIAVAPIGGAEKDRIAKREAARREFMTEYEKKSLRWQGVALQRHVFSTDWDDIRQNLARLTLRAADMEGLLKQSGLPRNPEETFPPTTAEAFRWAIGFAPFVRSRMNIADLIYWLGKDPAFILSVPRTTR